MDDAGAAAAASVGAATPSQPERRDVQFFGAGHRRLHAHRQRADQAAGQRRPPHRQAVAGRPPPRRTRRLRRRRPRPAERRGGSRNRSRRRRQRRRQRDAEFVGPAVPGLAAAGAAVAAVFVENIAAAGHRRRHEGADAHRAADPHLARRVRHRLPSHPRPLLAHPQPQSVLSARLLRAVLVRREIDSLGARQPSAVRTSPRPLLALASPLLSSLISLPSSVDCHRPALRESPKNNNIIIIQLRLKRKKQKRTSPI